MTAVYAAALTPRSWRFTDAISRLRKRHCRPFLKAGIMFRRANSLTVSGLRSSKKATSREFNKTSSFSAIFPSKRRLSGLIVRTDFCSLLTSPKSSFILHDSLTTKDHKPFLEGSVRVSVPSGHGSILKGSTRGRHEERGTAGPRDTTWRVMKPAADLRPELAVLQPNKGLHADGG
jgi:hypothetical protein